MAPFRNFALPEREAQRSSRRLNHVPGLPKHPGHQRKPMYHPRVVVMLHAHPGGPQPRRKLEILLPQRIHLRRHQIRRRKPPIVRHKRWRNHWIPFLTRRIGLPPAPHIRRVRPRPIRHRLVARCIEHRIEQHLPSETSHRDSRSQSPTRTVTANAHPVRLTPQPVSRCQPIVIRSREPMLRRQSVIHRANPAPRSPRQLPAKQVVRIQVAAQEPAPMKVQQRPRRRLAIQPNRHPIGRSISHRNGPIESRLMPPRAQHRRPRLGNRHLTPRLRPRAKCYIVL